MADVRYATGWVGAVVRDAAAASTLPGPRAQLAAERLPAATPPAGPKPRPTTAGRRGEAEPGPGVDDQAALADGGLRPRSGADAELPAGAHRILQALGEAGAGPGCWC